jgi:hypothetical protein
MVALNKEAQQSANSLLMEATKAIASYKPPDRMNFTYLFIFYILFTNILFVAIVVQRAPSSDNGLIPTIGGVAGKIVEKIPCVVMWNENTVYYSVSASLQDEEGSEG